jgi:heme-degrading monooxygenase HmoA
MIVILFRSKLTPEAGQDYTDRDAELAELVKTQPGFLAVKSFKAEDGERLTIVWWKDRETLELWRNNARHSETKQLGRQKWYEYYKMEVAEVYRESHFDKKNH